MNTEAGFDREAFAAFELAGWKSAAPHYDAAFSRLTAQFAPHLIEVAGVGPGVRLLDIACGPGAITGLALAAGARVTAVDFSAEMLAIAKSRHPGAEFRLGDAQALPFEDGAFDAVTMSFLLGHLPYPDRAMAEACRVLRPGGRMALSWWTPADQSVAFGIIMGAVEAAGNMDVGLPKALPFDHFRDPAMIAEGLAGAGFGEATNRQIDLTWTIDSSDAMFEGYLHGSVRTGGLMRRQTPQALEGIRKVIAEKTRSYVKNGRIELPMSAWIVGASRP